MPLIQIEIDNCSYCDAVSRGAPLNEWICNISDKTIPTYNKKPEVPDWCPKLSQENMLRELLFVYHGCTEGLYSDYGEMTCNSCAIDFKRDTADKITHKLNSKRGWSLTTKDEKPELEVNIVQKEEFTFINMKQHEINAIYECFKDGKNLLEMQHYTLVNYGPSVIVTLSPSILKCLITIQRCCIGICR